MPTNFGITPYSTTQLPINTFPVSTAFVPGTANGALTAVEGIGINVDGGGYQSTISRMGLLDGDDSTQGAKGDTAVIGDTAGSLSAKLRGLNKIFADVWDSTNHRLSVAVGGSLSLTGSIPAGNNLIGTVAWGGTATLGVPSNNGLTVVKNSAGRLASVIVTTSGSAQLNIYDNASQASGTILGAVPANAAVGSVYQFYAPAANGIVANAVANCCATTICFY